MINYNTYFMNESSEININVYAIKRKKIYHNIFKMKITYILFYLIIIFQLKSFAKPNWKKKSVPSINNEDDCHNFTFLVNVIKI